MTGTKRPPAEKKRPRGKKAEADIQFSSQWQLIWLKFRRHKPAVVSVFVLILIAMTALFCEFLAPYDPNTVFSEHVYAPPQRVRITAPGGGLTRPYVYGYRMVINKETLNREYTPDTMQVYPIQFLAKGAPYRLWGLIPLERHLVTVEGADASLFLLGTDRMGRDMFSRVIYGARVSTSIGLLGVLMSFVLGIFFGGVAGYYGGFTDSAIQRVIEFIRSIPTIPLWLALSAALPAHWTSLQVYFAIVTILSLIGWTGLARVVRSKFLSLKSEDFVTAARLSGAGDGRIITRHMIPSFSSHIIASITLAVPEMLIGETALSYLGLGLRPPTVSWGVLLQDAQNIRTVAMAPWLLIPAFAVIVTVIAFNFLGDGIRDAADPYSGQGRL